MKRKKRIFKALKLFTWAIVGSAFMVLLSASSKKQYRTELKENPLISINYLDGNFFVDKDDILDIIQGHLNQLNMNRTIGTLELKALEQKVESDPFIKNAEAFTDMHGNLQVEVVQRKPIVRVINRNGVSYYLDEFQELLPITHKFTSRVPIASGYISDAADERGEGVSEVLLDIFEIVNEINRNEFIQAIVEQIYVSRTGDYELVPKVGHHIVRIGNDVSDLNRKFDKLELFYKSAMKSEGWNKYRVIDLRFKNLVVCKKR